jgi:hypothetical protein
MKFISLLLKEGRKEDLQKKYSNKFIDYPNNLSTVLNISDLADTNFKYADFILKNLHPNSSIDEIDEVIELVKDFNKYQSNLEKKDINQYKSFDELNRALDYSRTKEEEKQLSSQAEKIYEDDKFLVIKPKTEEASCKYGSNTRWCVTSKGSGYFGRYTAGRQVLYFIINKQNSTNKNYSKVAVHFDDDGFARYWDSQDSPLTQREIDVLEYAFPEIIDSISEDYEKNKAPVIDEHLKSLFSDVGTSHSRIPNYENSNLTLDVVVTGFSDIPDMVGHAFGFLQILLVDGDTYKKVDEYDMFVRYNAVDNKRMRVDLSFESIDNSTNENFEDLGLKKWSPSLSFSLFPTTSGIRDYLANKAIEKVSSNPKLIKKVTGANVWNSDNFYGYTFKQNKGLIKSLVDWLDSNHQGTKLDFLESVGKLKSKVVNGKKEYSNGGDFYPSSKWRGHFSSFFASAKLAGIINYVKQGNKFIIDKGSNFDAFKSGKLRAR